MTDYSRTTKAELIKLLEEKQANKDVKEDVVKLDMSQKREKTERDLHNEAQKKKDFIKKMTRGKWTTEDKYKEVIAKQQEAYKIV